MTATFHASGNGGQDTGLSSFTVTCTITAGDSIVIYAGWDVASTTTPTVATAGGTGSDAFTLVYGPVNDLNSDKVGVWLLQSAGTGRTGVTVSWASSNPAYAAGFAVSFTGLVSPTLDQFVVGGANANTGNTPTLTSADEIAFQLALSTVRISTVNAPWTGDGPASGIENLTGFGGGHRILAATTPIASNFTNSSGNWQAYVWTFKAAATTAPFFQTDWGLRGAVKDLTGLPPQRINRNILLYPNPIPFKQTEWAKQSFLQPRAPDASQSTNLNLFKNPIPLAFNDPRYRRWVPRHLPDRIQHLNLPLITAIASAPFRQMDWSLPKDLLPSYTRAPDQPYNQSLYTVTVTLMGQIWL